MVKTQTKELGRFGGEAKKALAERSAPQPQSKALASLGGGGGRRGGKYFRAESMTSLQSKAPQIASIPHTLTV